MNQGFGKDFYRKGNSVKGSLLQNGFCANFSKFEATCYSPKNEPKTVPKNTPKNGVFSPNFSTEIFPEFSVCVFLQQEQQMPPENGLQKIQPENPSRHKAKFRVTM